MDNKEQENFKSDFEYNDRKLSNNYEFLVQKLKSIREIINLLEKDFL